MGNVTIEELRARVMELGSRVGTGRQEFYLGATTETVDKEKSAYITSKAEWAARKLRIDGFLHNDGFITIQEDLTVNGTLKNDGTIEVGW